MSEATLSINGSYNSNDAGNVRTTVPVQMPEDKIKDGAEEKKGSAYDSVALAYLDLLNHTNNMKEKVSVPSPISVKVALQAVYDDIKHKRYIITKNPAPLASLLKRISGI